MCLVDLRALSHSVIFGVEVEDDLVTNIGSDRV